MEENLRRAILEDERARLKIETETRERQEELDRTNIEEAAKARQEAAEANTQLEQAQMRVRRANELINEVTAKAEANWRDDTYTGERNWRGLDGEMKEEARGKLMQHKIGTPWQENVAQSPMRKQQYA